MSSTTIFSGAQYVTLQKCFSQPSLVIYFFSNPTYETKTGTANMRQTTNSKPPRPIIILSIIEPDVFAHQRGLDECWSRIEGMAWYKL